MSRIRPFAPYVKGSWLPWHGSALRLFPWLRDIPLCVAVATSLCIRGRSFGSALPLSCHEEGDDWATIPGPGQEGAFSSHPHPSLACPDFYLFSTCEVIFISLVANKVEHLFMCLQATGAFSLEKPLFKSFACF